VAQRVRRADAKRRDRYLKTTAGKKALRLRTRGLFPEPRE
jgi:hypothetical protein